VKPKKEVPAFILFLMIRFLMYVEFSYDILSRRLRELAFLNKGVTIFIEDERFDKSESFFMKAVSFPLSNI
jgi:DNA gyrase/topoisomerase IV subunit B